MKDIILKKDFEKGIIYYIPLSLVKVLFIIIGITVHIVTIMFLAYSFSKIIPWIKEGFKEN